VNWDEEMKTLEIGKAEVLQEGEDILLLAIGSMVHPSLEAARRLREREGIRAAVVNARFLKPLDLELFREMVPRGGKILTVEENVLPGGFGSAVLEGLEGDLQDLQIERMGIPDIVITHGAIERMRAKYGLCAESIFAKATGMKSGKSGRVASRLRQIGRKD
jgi:1-deoxy-D-xylulose-5-phosphate synthase